MRKPYWVVVLGAIGVCLGVLVIQKVGSANASSLREKIALGRYLFYDTRLSYNQTKSCVSCHDPLMAFTDGYRTSSGADGYNLKHNAPSLLNVVYRTTYTWANPSVTQLSEQLYFPFFNEHPKELGWKGNEQLILQRFAKEPLYQKLFKLAFPTQKNPFHWKNIQSALVAFESQLVSYNANYDRYIKGETNSLNEQAIAGRALFYSNRFNCSSCHHWEQPYKKDSSIFRNGIRVPSLRNVLLTAPYMHDGRLEDINAVLKYYENKYGLRMTPIEQQQLLAFFNALTDTSYLSNKELLNPFKYQ